MTDEELTKLLSGWKAPATPRTLRARVFRKTPSAIERLLKTKVNVPVPALLAAAALFLYVAYIALRAPSTTLSDFQEVKYLQPRIVRTVNETR